MASLLKAVKSLANSLLGALPHSILETLESSAQKQLGKGSGAWTTAAEAVAAHGFIQELSLSPIIAIDAGANLGEWSAELVKLLPHAQIIAFEPSAHAYEQLRSRFWNYDGISCFNLALGKSKSIATLFADKNGSGLGSLTNRRVKHFNITFAHKEEVCVETLDGFLAQEFPQLKPNVLKMDVEGHELEVLQGARRTLEDIRIVQFEFGGSNIDTRTFFQDFWYFFDEIDFQIYRLTPSGPIIVSSYSEQDETFRSTNYFAIRR